MLEIVISCLKAVIVLTGVLIVVALIKSAKKGSGCAIGALAGAVLAIPYAFIIFNNHPNRSRDDAVFGLLGLLLFLPPLGAICGAVIGSIIDALTKKTRD